jgi:thiamine-phosphate pyrophosphorylase
MQVPRLHVITDSVEIARAALAGGAPLIQVRVEDSVSDRAGYELAGRIAPLCAERGAICVVNDRPHIALALRTAATHVGADDLPVHATRALLGERGLVGASARTPERAREAIAEGADYLGCGQVQPSFTKDVATNVIGVAGLVAVVGAAQGVPVIAIGGLTLRDIPTVLAAGAHGVAVIGAVRDAADPARATADLLRAVS